jgi:NAD(P)-dependent dehydrogenase (short-subunit alcohol dehydrogenase family)
MSLRTFDGAVAIVTGGASGIGKAVAQELAARGGDVVLADIDAADAEMVASDIRARGGRATALRLDVTDAPAFHAAVHDTLARTGRLDYLFNNAGIAVAGEAQDLTLESWRRIVDVNFMGVVHGVLAAYPAMIRQGFGHIVNTASTAGLMTGPGMTSYASTKAAVVGLSKGLRAEAAGRGVRVTAVCPGVIRTPILQGGRHGMLLLKLPEAEQRQVIGALAEGMRPMEPGPFAQRLLDGLTRNPGIVVIPGWWRIVWWLERLSPAFAGWLAQQYFEKHLTQLTRAPAR